MVTYEVLQEKRRGLGNRAIRRIVDGKAQEGTVGAGYETRADAQYWLEQLTSDERVEA